MSAPSKFRETLSRVYQRFNALQRGEKRCFGVTMSQCVTLELLHQEGPKTVRVLADRLGLETSTLTRVVDVLVRDGLLRRTRDEKRDRRRVFISLTGRGRQLANKLEACADAYCDRILTRIPRGQREDVLHALRVLVEAIDELPESCA
ncbi:MAG: MarR family transcriptional regulator [Myxococcales bacterium]|nr:MarR family transcriptional regulator [Myxococcales bacterium]